jgi:hypothetical protein
MRELDPEIFDLIHGRLEEYKSSVAQYQASAREYMIRAIQINFNQLVLVNNYDEASARGHVKVDLQAQGWPEDSWIMQKVDSLKAQK